MLIFQTRLTIFKYQHIFITIVYMFLSENMYFRFWNELHGHKDAYNTQWYVGYTYFKYTNLMLGDILQHATMEKLLV